MALSYNGVYQGEIAKQDLLPQKAVNLARRVNKLAGSNGRGRHKIELLVTKDGRWLIIVDDGVPEDLGEE